MREIRDIVFDRALIGGMICLFSGVASVLLGNKRINQTDRGLSENHHLGAR